MPILMHDVNFEMFYRLTKLQSMEQQSVASTSSSNTNRQVIWICAIKLIACDTAYNLIGKVSKCHVMQFRTFMSNSGLCRAERETSCAKLMSIIRMRKQHLSAVYQRDCALKMV